MKISDDMTSSLHQQNTKSYLDCFVIISTRVFLGFFFFVNKSLKFGSSVIDVARWSSSVDLFWSDRGSVKANFNSQRTLFSNFCDGYCAVVGFIHLFALTDFILVDFNFLFMFP